MKALLIKLALATGFLAGANAVEPVVTVAPVLRSAASTSVQPPGAAPARRHAVVRPSPRSPAARALEVTVVDAQEQMRRLLREFGESEDASVEEALARHPEMTARMAEVFAGPEVRAFTPLPDGTVAMSVKRI